MSIKDHKWRDDDINLVHAQGENETIHIAVKSSYSDYVNVACIYKSDAIAIAKHFEIGREALVNKINALIEDVDKRHHTYWADDQKGKSMAYGYCAEELQSLINEELTSEEVK